jgi:hypothetical protein
MNILFVIVAIVAVVLLVTGGFVQSLNFLLWSESFCSSLPSSHSSRAR